FRPGMMPSVHRVAALAVLALAGAGSVAYAINRRQAQRDALALRAHYENRALMDAPVQPVRALPQRRAHSLPWQMVRLLRTQPLRLRWP
ncbi:MAG: hypothetical protein ACRDTV_05590, partial [Mycobacterium sp.]